MDLESEDNLLGSHVFSPLTVDGDCRQFTVIQFSSNPLPEEEEEEGPEREKRRCFLCLKEEKNDETTSFPVSNRLKPFAPILRYLMGSPPEESGGSLEEVPSLYLVLATAFENEVPPLCIACFDILGGLYDLHLNFVEIQRNIEMQTSIARSVVKRSSEATIQLQDVNIIMPPPGSTTETSNLMEYGTLPIVEKLREEIVKNYNNPVRFTSVLAPEESIFDSTILTTPHSSPSEVVPVLVDAKIGGTEDLAEDPPTTSLTTNEVEEWEREQCGRLGLQLEDVPLPGDDDSEVPSNVIWLLHEHEGQIIAAPTILLQDDPVETGGEIKDDEITPGEGEVPDIFDGAGEVSEEYGDQALINFDSLITFHCDNGDVSGSGSTPEALLETPQNSAAVETSPQDTPNLEIPILEDMPDSSKDLSSFSSASSSSSAFSPVAPPPPPPPPPAFPPCNNIQGRPRLSKSPTPATYHLCDVCSEQILKSEIQAHLQSHVGADFVFHCDTCKVSFLTPFRLDTFHKTMRPKSKKCPTYDPTHFKVTYLKCEQCLFQADSIFALKAHLTSHEKVGPGNKKKRKKGDFKCPLCPVRFTMKSSILIHLQDNHISNKTMRRREICGECNRSFPVNELESHMEQAHQVNPEFLLRCKLCPSMFSTLGGIVEHQRKAKICRIHPISCHLCNSQFEMLVPLRTHYAEKHGIRDRFSCRRCHSVFHSLQVYPAWALSEPDEPPRKEREVVWKYKCEKCGSTNNAV